MTFVEDVFRSALTDVFEETGPSASGVELGVGFKQSVTAHGAVVGSYFLRFIVFAGEGTFGMGFARNEIQFGW
jgi:hypothetical protein